MMSALPGPRIPSALQTYHWVRRPLPYMRDCAARYGDVFTIRLVGYGSVTLLSSPDAIRQVFTGSPEVLLAGRANAFLQPVVGSSSVLLLDRAPHLRQRRLLLPPFHGERMRSYALTMRDVTAETVERWQPDRPFPLHPPMQAITLRIILRTVFGVADGPRMESLFSLLTEMLDVASNPLALLPFFQRDYGALTPWRRFLRLREAVDRLLFEEIAACRADVESGRAAERDDVLCLLVQARDEDGQPLGDGELRDELVTLLVAGHETTATTACWVFERLFAHPEVYDRVVAELESAVGGGELAPDHLSKLPYLDGAIKETLRLRPVLPLVARELTEPFEVGGRLYPAGTRLAPCIYLTQRRADVYPDPERFDPLRFVGQAPNPYAWLPFGGGIRRCIGADFALYEIRVVLATLLSRVRLRAARPGPVPTVRRAITLTPSGGLPVVFSA